MYLSSVAHFVIGFIVRSIIIFDRFHSIDQAYISEEDVIRNAISQIHFALNIKVPVDILLRRYLFGWKMYYILRILLP